MLIYFLRGSLPWRRIRSPNGSVSETWDLIRDAKLTHDGQLFVGVPREIRELYAYARGMAFEEEVDWEGVRGLLQACANRNNADIESEGLWEWEIGRIVKPESGRRRNCAACQARRERSL
jgi:casein kinase I homolog HRR25